MKLRETLLVGMFVILTSCSSTPQRRPSGESANEPNSMKVKWPDGTQIGLTTDFLMAPSNDWGLMNVKISAQRSGDELRECTISVKLLEMNNRPEICVAQKLTHPNKRSRTLGFQ